MSDFSELRQLREMALSPSPLDFLPVGNAYRPAYSGDSRATTPDPNSAMVHNGAIAQDNSRQINGNVNLWQHLYLLSPNTISARDYLHAYRNVVLACLDSLAFKEMESRQQRVGERCAGTCEWLLEHPKYEKWLEEPSNLLWIEGNPGSGKSTLMNFALEMESAKRTCSVASFFFTRRGVPMQRLTIGLFRSLLYQLLTQNLQLLAEFLPTFQRKLNTEGTPGKECEWQKEELLKFFKSHVATKGNRVRIFVDALDECEDSASDIVSFFQNLTAAADSSLSICFSCRHFPSIGPLDDKQTICVEHHNEIDISTYIARKLRPSFEHEEQSTDDIEREISMKASGSFQWVELVVGKTLDLQREGRPENDIIDMLLETPDALNEIYREMLKSIKDKDRPRALHLMQWMCFAKRPLTLKELGFAMASDWPDLDHRPHEWHIQLQKSGIYNSNSQMERLLKTISGGLVEVKREGEDECTVQLIHQSVNDFFIQDRFKVFEDLIAVALDEKDGLEKAVGLAHHRLARSCINYATLKDVQSASRVNEILELPFIDYAVTSWVWHAERAEECGVLQGDIAARFQWPFEDIFQCWVEMYKQIDPWSGECPDEKATLLHVLSAHGIKSGVEPLLQDQDVAIEAMDSRGRTSLSYAAEHGHPDVVSVLMVAGGNLSLKDYKGRSSLWYAIRNGHEEVVRRLLEKDLSTEDDIRTSLWYAARSGYEEVVRVLLEKGSDVNFTDTDGRTLLWHATGQGQTGMVKLLIESAAAINVRDNDQQTALSLAADNGYTEVLDLLLRHDADADSKDRNGRTPLSLAADNGHIAAVGLLLAKNVEVDSKDMKGRTPLWYSALSGHSLVVKLLLENGADARAKDVKGRDSLRAAELYGHKDVIGLLSEVGCDGNPN